MKYVEGMCRNDQHKVRSHMYAMREDGQLLPMCGYGWNRLGGQAFSIFRGHQSARGTCKLCLKNIAAGKSPITDGWPHKTKWI